MVEAIVIGFLFTIGAMAAVTFVVMATLAIIGVVAAIK